MSRDSRRKSFDDPRPSPALLELVHRRWSIPVLALLLEGTIGVPGERGGGSKFVTLGRRLGVGPGSLRRTLAALIAQGWVMKNPGDGHPLRPEYVLTEEGWGPARACQALLGDISSLKVLDITLRKWSIPASLVLVQATRRFEELRERLPGITPRALALTVQGMEQAGLVERTVLESYPPRAVYSLSAIGRRVGTRASALQEALDVSHRCHTSH